MQYRSQNRITVQGRHTFDFAVSASVSLFYVADQCTYSKAAIAPGEYLKKKLDDYIVVNVRLSQSPWDDRITLTWERTNILHEHYEETC